MDCILATLVFFLMLRLASVSCYARIGALPRLPQSVSRRMTSVMAAITTSGAQVRLNPDVTSNKVIVLAGATSVGKSKVAQLLCEKSGDCEVVIADSVQIYKHLDIGSNKPSVAEQEDVPHHLVDICDPHETYSSGEFVRAAVPIIYDILNRGKVPVVVGGSTMYLQWLVQGTPDAPKASESIERKAEELLKEVESDGRWEEAVNILAEYDAERASSLGRNDWYRMRRYLEVALSLKEEGPVVEKGGRISNFPDLDLRCYFLSEDREQLYRMIDFRCEAMLKAGLIDEVSSLIQAGHLTPHCTAAKAIGYRQTIEYLGQSMLQESDDSDVHLAMFRTYLADFATATRNYAKRQLQWYRKDKAFLWLKIDRPDAIVKKSTEEEPYGKIVREILHWNDLPSSNFRQTIKHQMQRGAAVASIRGRMHQKRRLKVQGEMEWLAVAAMVAKGELKPPSVVPGGSADDGGTHVPSWAAQFTAGGDIAPPPLPDSSNNTAVIPVPRAAFTGVEADGDEDEELEGLLLGDPSAGLSHSLGAAQVAALEAEVDVDEDDEAVERLAMTGEGVSDRVGVSGLPRTLPSFPVDLHCEWSAQDITVRGAESVKGGKASMKMKRYSREEQLEASDLDEVVSMALGHVDQLKQSHPFLLADFFPEADNEDA